MTNEKHENNANITPLLTQAVIKSLILVTLCSLYAGAVFGWAQGVLKLGN